MQVDNEYNRIDVFLDDETEPLASYRPPLRFELDTTDLVDGPHRLRIEAYDSFGTKGVKTMSFTVRNGPGINVSGLRDNDVLEGIVPVLVNAYGGSVETDWEPSRAETPAPAPTWAWALLIFVVAFGLYYGVVHWSPPSTVVEMQMGAATAQSAPASEDSSGAAPSPAPSTTSATADEQSGAMGEAAAAEPSANEAEAPAEAAVDFDRALGESVYGSYCSSCHQANGQGMPGVFPPIAGDPVVLAQDASEHIDIVLNGLQGKTIDGVAYASPMPAFGSQLSDEQIAAVINYQRTSFGNEAPLVTSEEVSEGR